MKNLLKCLFLLLIANAGFSLHGQITDKKYILEPFKPFYFEYDELKKSTLETVNGKLTWVDESESSYKKRNAAHKKKMWDDYLKSKDFQDWLIKHKEWRDYYPDWKTKTMFPELIDYFSGLVTEFPKPSSNTSTTTTKSTEPVIGDNYIVNSTTLNLRTGPDKNATIITPLKVGDVLKLINSDNSSWWYVEFSGSKGYVYSKYLDHDPYSGWEKKSYSSGATPECENVTPKYDYTLDNYLKINVGSNTDVVVKLMKMGTYGDECIRIVYVRSNESFNIKNIPEGKYYLKIAYGKDYRQKIEEGKCVVKFVKNAQYEKGVDILDYNKEPGPNETINGQVYKTWTLPSFELSLDIIVSENDHTNEFNEKNISETEFNK
jgi:hypothetical protein